MKGFVGIHPNWSGINAESIRSLCLNAYLPEEVAELNDMTEMRSGKKSDMALLGIRVLLYWMSPNGKQALLQYRFRNVKNLKIYLCQIYRDSLKTYNNQEMRLLREECRHEFGTNYEFAGDNSG